MTKSQLNVKDARLSRRDFIYFRKYFRSYHVIDSLAIVIFLWEIVVSFQERIVKGHARILLKVWELRVKEFSREKLIQGASPGTLALSLATDHFTNSPLFVTETAGRTESFRQFCRAFIVAGPATKPMYSNHICCYHSNFLCRNTKSVLLLIDKAHFSSRWISDAMRCCSVWISVDIISDGQ